nr:major outer membrane protein variable domain IV, MOMP VD IV [Chlamydia trachomatis, mouse pneumonitis stain (MoPn; Nigg II), Peptide Partial, 9 aa] [Chlamydia trachomatis]
TTWNPTISG